MKACYVLPYLKVGQRIRSNGAWDTAKKEYYLATITNFNQEVILVKRDDGERGYGPNGEWRIKTSSEATIEIIESSSSSETSMPTTASNIMEFFANLTATAEEKLLKKYGLEDPIGTPTSVGLSLSAQIQYKANRAAIIEIAKKMEAEATADAKTN